MAEPGEAELRDDPTISDGVALLRQVNPKRAAPAVDWSELDVHGVPRLRAGAFQRASLEMARRYGYPVRTLSLYLEDVVITHHGSVAAWALAERPGWGVVRLTADLLRSAGGFHLVRDDLDGRLGHTVAWAGDTDKRAEAAQKVLAGGAVWLVSPDESLS